MVRAQAEIADAGEEGGVLLGQSRHAVGEREDDEASGDEHLQEEEQHGCGDGMRSCERRRGRG